MQSGNSISTSCFSDHFDKVKAALSWETSFESHQMAKAIITNRDVYERSTIYIAGNGGSASNASHLSLHLGDAGYNSVDLSSRIPFITAYANDYCYDEVFSRQTESLYPGDILFLISGSGRSRNLLSLIEFQKSRHQDIMTLGLLGSDGGLLIDKCDKIVHIKSNDYGVIEDCHSTIIHLLHKILMEASGREIREA